MNLANLLTVVRIVLLPITVYSIWRYSGTYSDGEEVWRWTAFCLFAVACASDIFDGYVARKLKCVSRAGAFLDAIADKLQDGVIIIVLAIFQKAFVKVFVSYVAIVVTKEIIMTMLTLILIKETPEDGFKPLVIGKASAFLQAAVIMWVLLKWPAGYIVFTISGLMAVLTAIAYIHRYICYLLGKIEKCEAATEMRN